MVADGFQFPNQRPWWNSLGSSSQDCIIFKMQFYVILEHNCCRGWRQFHRLTLLMSESAFHLCNKGHKNTSWWKYDCKHIIQSVVSRYFARCQLADKTGCTCWHRLVLHTYLGTQRLKPKHQSTTILIVERAGQLEWRWPPNEDGRGHNISHPMDTVTLSVALD